MNVSIEGSNPSFSVSASRALRARARSHGGNHVSPMDPLLRAGDRIGAAAPESAVSGAGLAVPGTEKEGFEPAMETFIPITP